MGEGNLDGFYAWNFDGSFDIYYLYRWEYGLVSKEMAIWKIFTLRAHGALIREYTVIDIIFFSSHLSSALDCFATQIYPSWEYFVSHTDHTTCFWWLFYTWLFFEYDIRIFDTFWTVYFWHRFSIMNSAIAKKIIKKTIFCTSTLYDINQSIKLSLKKSTRVLRLHPFPEDIFCFNILE